jgi:putative ABC transport system permease protein
MIDRLRELAVTIRTLRRHAAFAATSVATLALGLGAAIVVFAVADHVLWRALPFESPDRVVTLWETDAIEGVNKGEVTSGNFLSWAESSRSFEALGLVEPNGFDMLLDGRPVALRAWYASEGYFSALGVRPLLGRTFAAEEYLPGGPRVVMVSEAFWRGRLGADPQIVGRTIELDGQPVTVVGVLPSTADYPDERPVWAPKVFSERDRADRRADYRFAVGRLASSVTVNDAQRELDAIAANLAEAFPRSNRGAGVLVVPLEEQILGPVRAILLVLLAASGLLLAAACANVGNLCLTRYLRRRQELSVRAAVGAGRGLLLRQIWLESGVLALLGGAGGLVLAHWTLRVLVAAAPPQLPRVATLGLDGRALVFALLVTLASELVFGSVPALRLSRDAPLAALGGSLTAASSRLRGVLVGVQVALALLLLVGAGLLTRSLVRLLDNDLGFEPSHRVAVQVYLWDHNPTVGGRLNTVAAMREALTAVPGVRRAAVSTSLPFAPEQHDGQAVLEVRGRPAPPGEEPRVYVTIASDEYFEAMGVARLEGRTFAAADRLDAPRVAVVSSTLARRLFPRGDAVGSRVTIGAYGPPEEREIVGVVHDVKPVAFDSDPRAELYVPFAQSGFGSLAFVVQTEEGAPAQIPALAEAIWSVDPLQALYTVATLDDLVADTLAGRRLQRALLGCFAALALLLTACGLYGVVSYTVAARTREIGVRMALGAAPFRILGATLRQGLAMGAWGVLGGTLLATGATRLLRHLLYEVSPTDARVFAGSALAVLALCVAGALVPALRAARTDPVRALRAD